MLKYIKYGGNTFRNFVNMFSAKPNYVQLSGQARQTMEVGLNKARVVGGGLFPNTRVSTPTTPSATIIPGNIQSIPVKTLGIFPATGKFILKRINTLKSDLAKVIEYNRIIRPKSKFLVIDKAKSNATVYNGDKTVVRYNIGVGESVGDTLNQVSYDYSTKTFGIGGRTTPSGEFRTAILPESCANKSDYVSENEVNAILLKGVMHPASYRQNTSLALHQFPNNMYEERLKILNSSMERKGMSTGCINFKREDLQQIAQQLPNNTPVYILPEETGNSLKLVELPNQKLFFVTHYADKQRNNELEAAINKYFNFNYFSIKRLIHQYKTTS